MRGHKHESGQGQRSTLAVITISDDRACAGARRHTCNICRMQHQWRDALLACNAMHECNSQQCTQPMAKSTAIPTTLYPTPSAQQNDCSTTGRSQQRVCKQACEHLHTLGVWCVDKRRHWIINGLPGPLLGCRQNSLTAQLVAAGVRQGDFGHFHGRLGATRAGR